jgi:hypothetical protein
MWWRSSWSRVGGWEPARCSLLAARCCSAASAQQRRQPAHKAGHVCRAPAGAAGRARGRGGAAGAACACSTTRRGGRIGMPPPAAGRAGAAAPAPAGVGSGRGTQRPHPLPPAKRRRRRPAPGAAKRAPARRRRAESDWTAYDTGAFKGTFAFAYICTILYMVFFLALLIFQGGITKQLGICERPVLLPAAARRGRSRCMGCAWPRVRQGLRPRLCPGGGAWGGLAGRARFHPGSGKPPPPPAALGAARLGHALTRRAAPLPPPLLPCRPAADDQMNAHKRVLEMNTLAAGSNGLGGAGGRLAVRCSRVLEPSGRCAAEPEAPTLRLPLPRPALCGSQARTRSEAGARIRARRPYVAWRAPSGTQRRAALLGGARTCRVFS